MIARADHLTLVVGFETDVVGRSAIADDIRQAAEDGELSHETAWYLLDDMALDAWYEAYAPDCGAL